MKEKVFTTKLIQENMHVMYYPPDLPGQLVIFLPADDIENSIPQNVQFVEKENDRTGLLTTT